MRISPIFSKCGVWLTELTVYNFETLYKDKDYILICEALFLGLKIFVILRGQYQYPPEIPEPCS